MVKMLLSPPKIVGTFDKDAKTLLQNSINSKFIITKKRVSQTIGYKEDEQRSLQFHHKRFSSYSKGPQN